MPEAILVFKSDEYTNIPKNKNDKPMDASENFKSEFKRLNIFIVYHYINYKLNI
jgi:hypothetical protein